ncbi:MAG: hypothetical protein OXQ89_24560, partial [Rhodospirillaceae bacterium]|nr:hypothetical protein [Rhodospirillaceae bacterium]
GSALMNEVAELDEMAPDYGAVLDELRGVLQRIAILQLVGADTDDEEAEELPELASALSPEDVQLYYEIAGQGRRDLYISRDYRAAFEMTLLRMLAFRPATGQEPQSQGRPRPAQSDANKGAAVSPATAHPRQAQTARGGRSDVPAARGGRSDAPAAHREQSGAPAARGGQSGATAAGGGPSDTSADGPKPSGASAARGKPSGPADGRKDARQPKPEVNAPGPDTWHEFINESGITGAPRQLAEHCAIKDSTGNRLALVLASDNAHLNTERVSKRLVEQLQERFSGRVSVKIEVGKPPTTTPAQIRAKGESERMRKARASIEADPVVKMLQTEFDAVLEVDSIRPLESEQA